MLVGSRDGRHHCNGERGGTCLFKWEILVLVLER